MSYSDIKKKYLGGGNNSYYKTNEKRKSNASYSDIASKYGLSANIDQDYINSFISDANKYLSSAEEDYKKVGFNTAASFFESRNTSYSDLSERSRTVQRWLEANKNNIGNEAYINLRDTIREIDNGMHSVNSTFKRANDFYSSFATEAAANKYKQSKEEEQSVLNAEDFEEFSQAGMNVENPNWEDTFAPLTIVDWSPFGNGEKVNNIVTFAETNALEAAKDSAQALRGGGTSSEYTNLIQLINEHMTEQEKSIYNYYVGKGDTEKANEYITQLTDELRQRQAGKMVEQADGNALELVFSAVAGLDQFASGIKNIDNYILGKEADPTSAIQYAQAQMSSNNEGIWKVSNDLVNTTANMLPSILVGSVTGGLGGALTLGTSAVGNAYKDMRDLGYDEWQSRDYAALVGASETVLQYVMGGIGKLGGKITGKSIGKFVSGLDNAYAKVAATLGIKMASEGLEEAIQTAIEPAYLALVTGEDFEAAEWSEILYSGLLGSLSALGLEGAPTIAGTAISNIEAKKTYGDPISQQNLIAEAVNLDGEAGKFADRYLGKLANGKTLSGQELSNLASATYNENIKQDTSKIKNSALKALGDLGETSDVTKVADVITKLAKGEKLTSSDYAILNESKYGHQAAAEINPDNIKSGGLKNKWAENIGTKVIKPESYNKNASDLTAKQNALLKAIEAASMPNSSDEKENASERKFEVSENGKTIYKDADVKVEEIVSIEGENIKVKLDNGETVSASDLSFSTAEEADMYNMIARMDVTAETANELLSAFKPTNSSQSLQYMTNVPLAYKFGKINYEAGLEYIKLSEEQKRRVYNLGRIDAKLETKSNTPLTNNGKIQKKNGIIYEKGVAYDEATANDLQKASMASIEAIDAISNLEVHVFESKLENGERVYYLNGKREVAPNGFFRDGNKIYIDLNAGNKGEGAMLYTMAHEVTHYIRKWNAKGFKELADFLIEQYGKKGVPVNALIEEQIAKIKRRYEREKKTLPSEAKLYDMAYEEMVADAMSDMLADEKAYEKLAKLKQKNKSLWKKLGEAIKHFLDKIKSTIGIYAQKDAPVPEEAMYVRGFSSDVYNKLQDLYLKAFVEADNNYSSAEKTLAESGIAVNPDSESASLLSVRDVLSENQRQKVAAALATRFGVTQQEAMDWLKAETSMASLILNPKYSQYLDYTPDPNEDAIKQNSDYPQGTVDFSPICAKRREFTAVMNNILRLFPNHVFAATDLAKIRSIMQEEGMTIPCGICYVEDIRQFDTIVAQNFIDSLKLYREGSKTRPDGKPFNANQLKGLSLIDGDSYTPSVYELVSLKGLNVLKEKNPNMAEAWVKFNNARGMQSVRLLANEAEYKRQILKYDKRTVKSKNDKGGLRVYSFSDAEMFHLIDIIQVITDSATVGLSLQGYTKVNEYTRAVKDTGEKLNRSLIPKGELGYHIEDGKVVLDYDTVEGIDINHPDFFDNRDNPNVGNITIGVSDVQIRAAMVSDFVDQIIPFHTGQSEEVLAEKGIATWSNYKDFQTEKDIATGKVSEHQINIYTEVLQVLEKEGKPITKRTFVEKFLQVCKDNGLTPRFSQFLNTNEKGEYVYTEGYHKMLVDFKTFAQTEVGEYLPQMPVKPIFDNEYITKILKDYVKSQKVKDAELAESMPKVIERITNEIVKPSETQFSERDTAYLDAVNRGDMETAQRMVDEAAREAGYNSPKLYHGTKMFGFTEVKTSGVEKGVAWSPFFAANKEDISATYVPYGKVRDISSTMDEDAIEEARETAIEERRENISGLVDDFRRLIDRYFSEWVFGQSDNSYLESLVEDANPEAGHGDGVYDVLSDIVYNTFYDYQDEFAEYEDADDWSENAPEAQKIFSKIEEIEGEKSALYRLESGEELGGIYQLYANLDDMYVVDGKGAAWNELHPEGLPKIERGVFKDVPYKTRDVAEWARDNGYDGVIFKNIRDNGAYGRTPAGDVYAFFRPESQVKSADPVTYDDDGIVIPLSERFNPENNDIRYSERDYFVEDKYFKSQMAKWEDLKHGSYVNVGVIGKKHPLYAIGMPEGILRYDVDKLKKNMVVHGDYLDVDLLKEIPNIIADPIAISEYSEENTVSVFGDVFVGSSPMMVGVTISKDRAGNDISKVRTYNTRRDAGKLITDDTILYLDEDKKRTRKWFQSCGIQVPLGETKFGFIRSISQKQKFVKSKFSDTDAMHSDRDTDAVSNRTLLANALESVAQNDIEKNKLEQYKRKISLIESEQAKLDKNREEAKELRFKKGRIPSETKRLRELDAEATQLANRISTYDKQLLNLESTTALKNVLEREKTMVRKRTEQKGKEALKRQKEKAAETQRELLTRWQESRHKAVEGRNKTAMRHKIKNVVSDLNKLLLNPTKEQHVPIGLQKVVAEALDAINMDTMNAEERVAYYNALIAKSSDPDEIAMLTKKRDFFEYRDANFKDRITALKNAYVEFKESDDPLIRNAHNEAIENLIKNVADEVGNSSLKDMSLAQLEAVYDMYKAVLATVRNSNKLFKEGKKETISETSETVKTEVKEVGGHKDRINKLMKTLKKFGWNMLKPITAMKAIGSQTFENLFANVRAGEDTWAVDVNEAKEFYEDKATKYNYSKWDFKKRYTFKDSAGQDFSLSLEQIMSLYAYSKRAQADVHLEDGGFVFDDAIEVVEKNKLGIPMKYEVNDATPYRLRKEDLATVTSALSTEQKSFVDEMQTYLSEVMGAKGNEVSLAMYDIKLYKENNYFPLKTSRYFREFDPEKSGTPKIRNSGFSKKTVPNAGNPIVLSNFMDVWANHVNDMSMYHAFVLPLEDFMRVYNYSSTAGGYDSVQQYIKNAYGAEANLYIEKLMDDLNGGARVDSTAGIINKGISLFKKSSVFASASVVIQQPSAIARAFAYINPKYFAKSMPSALNLARHKELWAEVKKYAPVAVIKEMGYFDTGVGRSTVDWIKGNHTIGAKVDDFLSKAPAIADEITWSHIWQAVKSETKATTNLKEGSEEFLKRCGKRFTEVIINTQVYDSVLARSGMMRSKDTGMKMATAFMAEPTTTVNMVIGGIIQGKRGNGKFLAATVGAVSASIILNSILVSLVYAARDDDEDETYTEKYVGSVTSEILDGFNPLTYVPFVKDVWSIAQGYDVERSDMSVVSNLWENIEGLFNEDKRGWEKVADTTGAVSSLFGLPLKNILRDAKGMYNLTQTVLSDTPTTKAGIGDSVEDAFKNSIPLWGRLTDSETKSDKLYEAIISGDQNQINRIKGQLEDEKAIESAMRQGLREHDSRIKEAAQARYEGDIAEYTRIAKEIIREGSFSQDIVVGAINAELNAIRRGETIELEPTEDTDEVTSIYSGSDINYAFDNGDSKLAQEIISELIETKVANGTEEKNAISSLRSSMTSYWKPLYKQAYNSGNASEMARIRKILYSSGLYGTANDVVKTTQNWQNN